MAYPHGGPHSVFDSSYTSLFTYFVSLGFHVLLVNYRGSIGYGDDVLESLIGKCGYQDVEDTIAAIDYVCKLVRHSLLREYIFFTK